MIDDLVAVEFCPSLATNAATKALSGAIGETRQRFLARALSSSHGLAPVRFPLLLPNSTTGLYPERGVAPFETAVRVPANEVYVLKRKPLSLYERRRHPFGASVAVPLGSEYYVYTNSRANFLAAVEDLCRCYPRCWALKAETGGEPTPLPYVFLEARFYSADTVISTYDPATFNGIAFEVLVRNNSFGEKDDYVMRSNTFLCSASDEYVTHVDGVDVAYDEVTSKTKRWGDTIQMAHRKLLTPTELLAQRRDARRAAPPKGAQK